MFNRTSASSDFKADMQGEHDTLISLLRTRAQQQPSHTLYTIFSDGATDGMSLSCGELDRQARRIAARLQAAGASHERILLLFPSGFDYISAFFGCLYAGAVAVPAYPPRLNRNLGRLQAIAADAEATVALTTTTILSRVQPLLGEIPRLRAIRWAATDEMDEVAPEDWQELSIDGDALAFLQYTSGSTAEPKGVMVTHANLLRNEEMIRCAFGQSSESIIVGWLPMYHDMGLIGNLLQPLFLNARCVLMSPTEFLQRPASWLQAISKYRATTSGGPNFAYELCARRVTPEQQAELDLSSWSVAFNGAEPVRADTLERFSNTFAACGFRRDAFQPCYGLAEATLIVSGGRRSSLPTVRTFSARGIEQSRVEEEAGESARTLVGCGLTLPEEVVIVNPATLTRSAHEQIGEIWVLGSSVARGYWNREEETTRTFNARLLDAGESAFLRTGDLGFLKDGELFITGRIKDLIVIRGRNLYPQDVELTVERSHSALRPGCGAAFAVEHSGEERLAIVQEISQHRTADINEALASIRQAVSEEHEAPLDAIVLIKAGTIPKTSSGKIQRQVCRLALEEGNLTAVGEWRRTSASGIAETGAEMPPAPLTAEEIEKRLSNSLATGLGMDASEIDVTQPITRYGLDSLFAVELAQAIETSLGVAIPVANLLSNASIVDVVSQAFAQRRLASFARLTPHAADEEENGPPLSSGQRSLWFMRELAPESAAYNLAYAARVRSSLDSEALHRAFQFLTDRHASLRSAFRAVNGAPTQYVHERMAVDWCEFDASQWSEELLDERLNEEAQRLFELERGSLLRICLFSRGASEHVLLLVAHHIVADFWSLAVLMDELGLLYEAEKIGGQATLPPLKLQYTDYSRWQAEFLRGDEGERLWNFWRERLCGELPTLELPLDHRRPPIQTYRGAAHTLKLDAELTEQLKGLSRAHGATLYTTLLAAFYSLLYRYTGQEDILVGSPMACRSMLELKGLVGYFVNPVVLRAKPSANAAFVDFLTQVREVALATFAHQDYPFPALVERLQPGRIASRSPLFQTMFVYYRSPLPGRQGLSSFALGEDGGSVEVGGLRLESVALKLRIAQFDLALMTAEAGGALIASLRYNTDLFEAATIARMSKHFENILRGVTARPTESLFALPLLNEDERRQLVGEWNETKASYPHDQTIHGLFERQAEQTPDAVALVAGHERLTYSTLNRRANQLARYLRRAGAGAELTIGVCMSRTPSLVVAMLGALKAGGAYVPLDPAYPKARVAFMLDDARSHILLKESQIGPAVSSNDLARPIDLNVMWETIAAESGEDLPHNEAPDNLAYVIYTSGTTGRPKGVAITHRSVVALITWAGEIFSSQELAGVLASTSICFDLSVFELFVTLCCGGKVVLADNALRLSELPAANEVRLVNTVPSAMTELLNTKQIPASVRAVNLAGEPLLNHLAREVYEQGFIERLFNLYGPSEDTTYSSFALMSKGGNENSLIGRPISNTQIYLLDSQLQPVPVGIPGEVYIGGDGLARCYLHQPGLTAGKFIPAPFGDESGARLYQTQDLARRESNGEIVFLGRIDNQVKVRGYRIELGEVESVLSNHPKLQEAIVIAVEAAPGDKRLVAYVVVKRGQTVSVSELRNSMREQLPEFMLPSTVLPLDALPLTPNGKVDRRALPVPDFGRGDSTALFVAPRSAFEEAIAEIWSGVLGVSCIGVYDNFFELGGHSLLATQVIARLRQVFQLELSLSIVFERSNIAELAEYIEKAISSHEGEEWPSIEHIARAGGLPLSFAQQRLWLVAQLDPHSPAYNMPVAMSLLGRLDTNALSRSLREVVRRHESLRTSFTFCGGEPVQLIHPDVSLDFPLLDLSTLPIESRRAEAQRIVSVEARRPFDFSSPPLFRARLLRLAADEHLLLLVLHHITSDGWSMRLIVEELSVLYAAFSHSQASPLEELPIHYADYAVWQRTHLQGLRLERLLLYWRARLSGTLTMSPLLAGQALSAAATHRAARHVRRLSPELTAGLKKFSQREGVTLFMTLLAGFKALLARYSGQEDIVVGTVIANRGRVEIERLIGFFVNTLALRTDLSGDPSFRELLGRVRETALGAYAHQDMPFERLVEELQPERDLRRTPLFQVMLVLQATPLEGIELEGLEVGVEEVGTEATKFDLLVAVEEREGRLEVTTDYSAELFEEWQVERLIKHWENLLDCAVMEPERRVSDLEILSVWERLRQLEEWNATDSEYEREASIHELFEREAARRPQAVAASQEGESITYGELNERANRVARRLRELGVGLEERVGVCVERGIEMVVGLLGVLKAGGAYVPLDAEYPAERMRQMMVDAGMRVVVTWEGMRGRLPQTGALLLCLEAPEERMAGSGAENLPNHVTAENLAYVMYTSGSTGAPKGVSVTHRSVTRLVRKINYARFGEEDIFLQFAPISFDASTLEIWGSLVNGARLVVMSPGLTTLEELGETVRREGVTTLWLTAGLFHLMVDEQPADLRGIRRLLAGGDVLSVTHVRKFLDALREEHTLINGYGPTENTTFTCCFPMTADTKFGNSVPIGRPISNTQVYILDHNLTLAPQGVVGELMIGGDGLARDYFNRPALTAERFIPHPFSDAPGGRLYQSSDLVRRLSDGNLEFVGRKDQQVKIRGFRVELGEIEALLSRHDSVKECVVVACEDAPGEKRIVAYVTSDSDRFSKAELRQHLNERLPSYMIPSAFVLTPEFPLTSNGKINRRALPKLDELRPEVETHYVEPRTPIEKELARIWCKELRVKRVGIRDNFFELGGHSLLATQFVSAVREHFQVEVALRNVFETPTIEQLAIHIEQQLLGRSDSGGKIQPRARNHRIARLREQLKQLSDEEVNKLLEAKKPTTTKRVS